PVVVGQAAHIARTPITMTMASINICSTSTAILNVIQFVKYAKKNTCETTYSSSAPGWDAAERSALAQSHKPTAKNATCAIRYSAFGRSSRNVPNPVRMSVCMNPPFRGCRFCENDATLQPRHWRNLGGHVEGPSVSARVYLTGRVRIESAGRLIDEQRFPA